MGKERSPNCIVLSIGCAEPSLQHPNSLCMSRTCGVSFIRGGGGGVPQSIPSNFGSCSSLCHKLDARPEQTSANASRYVRRETRNRHAVRGGSIWFRRSCRTCFKVVQQASSTGYMHSPYLLRHNNQV